IMEVVKKIQGVVDKALDTAINFIISKAKALFKSLFGSKDAKPDTRSQDQKRTDLSKGIAEAQALLANPKLSSDEVKKKLPDIKTKNKITILQLVTDAKTAGKETDHIHGEIHSDPVKADGSAVEKVAEEEKLCSIKISRPGFRQSLKDRFREEFPGSHKGMVLA